MVCTSFDFSDNGEEKPPEKKMFVNWLTKDNRVKVIARPLEASELVAFEQKCTKEHGPGDIELFDTPTMARLYADKRR